MPKRSSTHIDNLTLSRIHTLLRPYETKLNALLKALHDRKVPSTQYAPALRIKGATYSKRHRHGLRARGMSVQQAKRVEGVGKERGLVGSFGLEAVVVGVEEAFRNLVRGCFGSDGQRSSGRVASLQSTISKMIGRQVAEETQRDKEELEEEGVDDCIGLWYGNLTPQSRKDALVSHALELIILRIPVFILELWKGLLYITLQAHLAEESNTLLEDILLCYLTPLPSSSSKSAANHAPSGRDLTDLYTQYTSIFPPADFLGILLPTLELSPPSVWGSRAIQHLIRHLDGDLMLTARIVERMSASACYYLIHPPSAKSTTREAKEMDEAMSRLVHTITAKSVSLLGSLISDPPTIETSLVHEVLNLTWVLWILGQHLHLRSMSRLSDATISSSLQKTDDAIRIRSLACALDVHLLSLISSTQGIDQSDIFSRLSNPKLVDSHDKDCIFTVLTQSLKLFSSPHVILGGDESSIIVKAHSESLEALGLHDLALRLLTTSEAPSPLFSTLPSLSLNIKHLKRKSNSTVTGGKMRRIRQDIRVTKVRKGNDDDESTEDDGSWCTENGDESAGESLTSEEEGSDVLLDVDSEEKGSGPIGDHHGEEVLSEGDGGSFVGRRRSKSEGSTPRSSNGEEDSQKEAEDDHGDWTPQYRQHRVLQTFNRPKPHVIGPAPVLQSVVKEGIKDLQARMAFLSQTGRRGVQASYGTPRKHEWWESDRATSRMSYQKQERWNGREAMPSSDDDLDLLGDRC